MANRIISGLFNRVENIITGKETKELKLELANLKQALLTLEQERWVPVGATADNVFNYNRWSKVVKQSRIYYAENPFYRNAIRLYTAFVFGRGATFVPKDKSLNDLVNSFTQNADNTKCLFSSMAQNALNNKLIKDGELWLLFFESPDGTVLARLADAFEISDIISEPDDPQTELYYIRNVKRRKWNFGQGSIPVLSAKDVKLVYRSIEYYDYKDYEYAIKDMLDKHSEDTNDAYLYHIIAPENDPLDNRGIPPFNPSIPWIGENKISLEIMVSYIKALTCLAWKKRIKGTATDLANAKTATASNFAIDEYTGRTPTGAVSIEAEGGDTIEPIERSGGLANAINSSSRQLKLGMCSGFGLPEQYMADASTGNLATAESMELPTLKIMEQWQQFWIGTYERIFDFYFKINENKVGDKDRTVQVIFPDIVHDNVPELITAVNGALIGGSIPEKQAIQTVLSALGYKDIDTILDDYLKEEKEESEKSENTPMTENAKILEIRKLRKRIEANL